jgi:hypothetical protein
MEQLVGRELTRGTEIFGNKLRRCYFTHHKSRIARPGTDPGKPQLASGRWPVARSSLMLHTINSLNAIGNQSVPKYTLFLNSY